MGVASATARSALTTDALCALQAERNRLTEKLSAQALAHTREREAWHAQTKKLREQLDEHERGAAAFAAERRNMEKMMLAHTRERESWHSQTLALRTQLSEALRGAVPKSLASSNGGPPAPPIRGAMPLSAARDEAEMPIHVSKPARAPAEMPVPQRQGRPSAATSGSGGEPHSSPGASSDEPPVAVPAPSASASTTPTRSPARSHAPSPPTSASQGPTPPRSPAAVPTPPRSTGARGGPARPRRPMGEMTE